MLELTWNKECFCILKLGFLESAEYSLYSRQWTNNFVCMVRSNFIDIDASSIQSFTHSEKLHIKRDLSDFQISSNFSPAKLFKKEKKGQPTLSLMSLSDIESIPT